MALLPAKTSSNAKSHSSSARFRQRKISVKQPLGIYKQRDLSSTENELEPSQINHLNNSNQPTQQRDLHAFETGVDKNEEDEVHLQQVINAATKALLGSKDDSQAKDTSVYIPTPDASGVWKDAPKYYSDQKFIQPESYIKFSATIEDTVGVEYNMDEDDEVFFNDVLNKSPPKKNESACLEIEFEMIVDKFEKTIEERQPFLSVDPSNLHSFQELKGFIMEEFSSNTVSTNPYTQVGTRLNYLSTAALKEKLSQELKWKPFVTTFDKQNNIGGVRAIPKLLDLFGESIYNHWKARKLERKGKFIHPNLKFEDPSANEKENDADPYICFRRREFRQARKTRRADTLGAERIRILQKSLISAREIILNVAQREILKLQNFEVDEEIFKLRGEAKTLKRSVGIKGDDHLFYPHKRKKIIKIRDEEETIKKEKRMSTREQASISLPGSNNNNAKQSAQQAQNQQETSSSSQPYVKLPPSKIPDMDLVTVSLVLKEKNDTIKRAVMEKLRKRKEQDKGYINLTDDPYQPFFNITTNNDNFKEITHIPYSSIAAANYHQINTTNYLNDSVKKIVEDGKKSLPGVKTLRGSNGELIPSKAFPHLSTLLQYGKDKYRNQDSVGYIAQLLSNIESSNYNTYNNGYGQIESDEKEDNPLSDPIFRLRKRQGRNNRTFIDRRSLVQRPDDLLNDFINFEGDSDNDKVTDADGDVDMTSPSSTIPNVYDSRIDVVTRLDSRWKFDSDLSEAQRGVLDPFGLDPSRLNSISDDTQSIRFGSMLLSKSYGLLRDAVHQKQQLYLQQVRLRALQQSNRQAQQPQSQNNGSQSQQPNVRTTPNAQRQMSQKGSSQQLPNSNYSLGNKPGNGLPNTSPQLNSQQPNTSRDSSTAQLYNNNNNTNNNSSNASRSGSNYSDSKLTNNFNAQNLKHYNKTSPIASSNKLSAPVSATHK